MIGNLLKKLFGDKNAKDQKLYEPFSIASNEFQLTLKSLSDNELREKTFSFQLLIAQEKQSLEDEMLALEQKAADTATNIDDKEEIFEKIDKISKAIDEKIEESLLKILPEAFAVVKETAQRWVENGKLEVDALDFDRELAARKDGITISGDKAIWHNEWTAAGAKIKWNMVHYDVQLIGGAALHKGNIAEMQTRQFLIKPK